MQTQQFGKGRCRTHDTIIKRVTERLLIILILFLSGMAPCMPVPQNDEVASLYPWWAVNFSLGNVQLYEMIFIVWIIFFAGRAIKLFQSDLPTNKSFANLTLIALWCGAVSLTAPLIGLDIGRTARLLLNAFLLLAVTEWTKSFKENTLLAFVMGIIVGTLINLIISFRHPLIIDDVMRLSGQNTPGVAMGIGIHLSAWLFHRSAKISIQLLSILSTLILAFSCALSFSRVGWFVGLLGGLTWVYLFCRPQPSCAGLQRQLINVRVFILSLLSVLFLAIIISPWGQPSTQWINDLIRQKTSAGDDSNRQRKAYYDGTIEIILNNPFGVGYSGFYDAMTTTKVYGQSDAAREESAVDANPHSTLLWYASAGGIVGLLFFVMVFARLLYDMGSGLKSLIGRREYYVSFWCIVLAYIVMCMTVPYLLNGTLLIIPVAVAAGCGSKTMGVPLPLRR